MPTATPISLSPRQALEVGRRLHQDGQFHKAQAIYRQVLEAQPDNPEALHLLGLVAHQVGQHTAAVELIGRAIRVNPNVALYHRNLGIVYTALGRLADAAVAYQEAARLAPRAAENHQSLGDVLVMAGNFGEAIAAYRRAIAVDPQRAAAHGNMGVALDRMGKLGEAIAACRTAVAIDPGFADAWHNLGIGLAKSKCLDDAMAAQQKAIALRPDHADSRWELGCVWQQLCQYDRAVECYHEALAIRPESPRVCHSLGTACYEQGQYDEAVAWFTRAIELDGDFAEAHWHRAVVRLLRGDFEQGWRDYEWRWRCREIRATARRFAQPQWMGEPLSGKRLLLYAEQGFGDAIQFVRYAALATEQGARVIVECHPELVSLFAGLEGVDEVVGRGETLPDFDVQASLLSLPLRFGARLDAIPNRTPYLRAPRDRVDAWRERVGPRDGKLRVGLAWAGSSVHSNDHNRSVPLGTLAPLDRVNGVSLYSLQRVCSGKPEPTGLQRVCSGKPQPTDLMEHVQDFADTAALVEQLDLIICVDTAVAHLAGALGKPTWIMLPFVPDFRWLLDRSDSAWYPTVRLFRQSRRGDWAGVIERIAAELAGRISA